MEENITSEPTPIDVRRVRVLRIGWGTIGLGLLIGIVGAGIGAVGANRSNYGMMDTALIVRNVAAAVMLIGLAAILISQRLEWVQARLAELMDSNVSAPASEEVIQAQIVMEESGQAVSTPSVVAFFCTAILAWMFLGLLPQTLRGMSILLVSILAPMLASTAAFYSRGNLRAFGLGTLFPVIANMLIVCLIVAIDSTTARRSSQLWTNLASVYTVTTLAWIMAVIMGLLAMGIRAILTDAQSGGGRRASRGD